MQKYSEKTKHFGNINGYFFIFYTYLFFLLSLLVLHNFMLDIYDYKKCATALQYKRIRVDSLNVLTA